MMTNPKYIVFFDANCSFCNYWVSVLIRLDSKKRLCFAPLDGNAAKMYLSKDYPDYQNLNTVIFRNEDAVSFEAQAIFSILEVIGGLYSLFSVLKYLPSFMTNPFYRFIAKRRKALRTESLKDIKEEVGPERYLD